MEKPQFDNEAHEAMLAERYRKLAMIDAFDRFIDLSIDGVITREEAIEGFKSEYADELKTAP